MNSSAAKPAVRRAKIMIGAILICLIIGGIVIFVLRAAQSTALAAATELHAKQYVTTVRPQPGGKGLPLTLPGTLQGINEATVYARSNGYIVRWLKDIGSSVVKGELLAEITAPEVDQELSQAIAAQQLAASSEALARSTVQRWKSLREKDAVTQQDYDERQSTYSQAQANLASAQANVERLKNLQGFNRVVAPFNGVITRRNIDVGDLVDAGNGGAGKALFSIAQLDPLRLYVFVPQIYAAQVKVGDTVRVGLADHLSQEFEGAIARTARAIDSATRTMQVEIRVPNPKGELMAGSFVQVMLPIQQDGSALIVPTNVLLFRADGPRIALVDARGQVHLSTVKLGTDFGSTVAILSGVGSNDQVVLNPADSLTDGDVVSVKADEPAGETAAAAPVKGP